MACFSLFLLSLTSLLWKIQQLELSQKTCLVKPIHIFPHLSNAVHIGFKDSRIRPLCSAMQVTFLRSRKYLLILHDENSYYTFTQISLELVILGPGPGVQLTATSECNWHRCKHWDLFLGLWLRRWHLLHGHTEHPFSVLHNRGSSS